MRAVETSVETRTIESSNARARVLWQYRTLIHRSQIGHWKRDTSHKNETQYRCCHWTLAESSGPKTPRAWQPTERASWLSDSFAWSFRSSGAAERERSRSLRERVISPRARIFPTCSQVAVVQMRVVGDKASNIAHCHAAAFCACVCVCVCVVGAHADQTLYLGERGHYRRGRSTYDTRLARACVSYRSRDAEQGVRHGRATRGAAGGVELGVRGLGLSRQRGTRLARPRRRRRVHLAAN